MLLYCHEEIDSSMASSSSLEAGSPDSESTCPPQGLSAVGKGVHSGAAAPASSSLFHTPSMARSPCPVWLSMIHTTSRLHHLISLEAHPERVRTHSYGSPSGQEVSHTTLIGTDRDFKYNHMVIRSFHLAPKSS